MCKMYVMYFSEGDPIREKESLMTFDAFISSEVVEKSGAVLLVW
jgi:hypothetical protein